MSIVSEWAGHDDSACPQKIHVHVSDDDLHQGGTALAEVHKIA